MLKSLRNKLVLVFIVLILSVMGVLSAFLINSVTTFYFSEFNQQVSGVFSTEVLENIEKELADDSITGVAGILSAYSGNLGISAGRDYFVLSAEDLSILVASSKDMSKKLEITPNITLALKGEVGTKNSISSEYLDVAIPINNEIIYVIDNKVELENLKVLLLGITLQAMLVGVISAVVLSLFLSKTMTNPIENLTKGAEKVAKGEFYEPIEVSSTDEIGTLTKTFNQMSDKLKETLNEVSDEKNKLSTLFLHMTDGVLAFQTDGSIINMNLKAQTMLGVEYSEKLKFSNIFKGIKLPESTDDEGRYAETVYEVLGKTYRVLFAPLESDRNEEKGIIVVVYDITESKKLEDLRKEFVANVSHELRTPLTNVKSYTETILDNIDSLDSDTEANFLNIISSETDRMTRIVSDLLTLSRFDHGKMDIKVEKVDTNQILHNVSKVMKIEMEKSNITFKTDILEKLPCVMGDIGRLEQVFINLLSNAVKYSLSGKQIEFIAKQVDEMIVITVIDEGFGIPKEDLPRVFERFYRVDKARSREKGGTGLGLAITKEIIDAHHGKITIDSQLEKGTTVCVSLPIADGEFNEKV